MTVEALAGSVVAHGRPRVSMPGGYLDIARVYPGIQQGRDESAPEHVRTGPGGALEPGQVGSHGEPQPVSYRHKAIGGDWDQFGEVRHDLTLRPLPAATKLAKPAPGAA